MTRTHAPLSLARAAAALAVLVAVGAVACTSSDPAAPKASPTTTAAPITLPAPTTPGTAADPNLIPVKDGYTLTATPHGSIQGYDGPNGNPTVQVTNTYYNVYTVLPVFELAKDWVHVRLAPKPNGSTAWVKVSDVDIGSTPWQIVINLSTKRLQLFKEGKQLLSAPVGIGKDATPTVTGDFFVTFLQAPPIDPATKKPDTSYGPFEVITSGHSDVLQEWQGFPDGILAIHGPVDGDAAIGQTGNKISNGCIRMHKADQLKLGDVQPGSPIQIIAG